MTFILPGNYRLRTRLRLRSKVFWEWSVALDLFCGKGRALWHRLSAGGEDRPVVSFGAPPAPFPTGASASFCQEHDQVTHGSETRTKQN